MPKIDSPEIGKGFWVTLGVLLALLLVSMATMLLQRARQKA